MADDSVLLNSGYAPFVEHEYETGAATVEPGSFVTVDADGDVTITSGEAATGTGLICGLGFDPDVEIGSAYASGETVRLYEVPIGGQVRARLAAGGDLTTAADATISEGELLVETDLGAVAAASAGTVNSTVQGSVYRALEAVDNAGASAGQGNQVAIKVERIA